MRRRKTEIVVELDEEIVIRGRQPIAFAWCAECGEQVQTVTPDHASTITGVSPRVIYRWIEAGMIHFNETGEGHLLVCQSSLAKLVRIGDDFGA